jgi:long-chain acyl-CoA synthetase
VGGAGPITLVTSPEEVERVRAEVEPRIEGATVLGGFLETVARTPDEEALRWQEGDQWRSLSWREYRQAVEEVTLGLQAHGFARGELALLLSRNRPEPHVADLAVQAAGGVPVSLHTTLAPGQAARIAEHSEASVAFVEDAALARALGIEAGSFGRVRTVVLLEPDGTDGRSTLSWDGLRAAGRERAGADELEAASARLTPDDLATLVYTSGTTGDAKGVMITQRNVRWTLAAGLGGDEPSRGERFISYLPLATVGGRIVDLWAHVVFGGAVVAFCPDATRLFAVAREIRPTIFLGVPAVWEQLHAELTSALAADPEPRRREAVRRAVELSRHVASLSARGEPVPEELAQARARVMPLLAGLRAGIGLDQCKRAVSGGAAIDGATLEFFEALGLSITQSWGMSELTSGVASDGPTGTVGRAYPGVELALAEDGEILVRGPLVMKGYYRDPDATREVVDEDGWLHTGDLGAVREDGHLQIVGRKKELIVLASGTNVAPGPIELLLQRHPLVVQACVFGDGANHPVALVTLDRETAGAYGDDEAALYAEVAHGVAEANGELSGAERVACFRIVPGEWSVESGELTPTFKKRRSVIAERYAGDVAQLYRELDSLLRRSVVGA